jgi:hypothetical protein
MKQETLGILRHLLTFGGGYLVAQDWINPELVPELVGAVMTILGAIWSVKDKKS